MRVASHALDHSSSFTLAIPNVLSAIRPFITQGTTRSDRVGNRVFVFTWTLTVLLEPVLLGPAFHVRFLVWRSFTRLPLTAMVDILESASVLSPLNYDRHPMFTILYDEVWLMPVGDGVHRPQIYRKLLLDISSDFTYTPPNLITNGVLQWGLHQNSGASIEVAVDERIDFSSS